MPNPVQYVSRVLVRVTKELCSLQHVHSVNLLAVNLEDKSLAFFAPPRLSPAHLVQHARQTLDLDLHLLPGSASERSDNHAKTSRQKNAARVSDIPSCFRRRLRHTGPHAALVRRWPRSPSLLLAPKRHPSFRIRRLAHLRRPFARRVVVSCAAHTAAEPPVFFPSHAVQQKSLVPPRLPLRLSRTSPRRRDLTYLGNSDPFVRGK